VIPKDDIDALCLCYYFSAPLQFSHARVRANSAQKSSAGWIYFDDAGLKSTPDCVKTVQWLWCKMGAQELCGLGAPCYYTGSSVTRSGPSTPWMQSKERRWLPYSNCGNVCHCLEKI